MLHSAAFIIFTTAFIIGITWQPYIYPIDERLPAQRPDLVRLDGVVESFDARARTVSIRRLDPYTQDTTYARISYEPGTMWRTSEYLSGDVTRIVSTQGDASGIRIGDGIVARVDPEFASSEITLTLR